MLKKNNRFILIALILLLTLFLGACNKASEKVSVGPDEKLVEDCVKRQVAIPKSPKKVAALDSFAGEAMIMIGAGKNLVSTPMGVKSDKLLCEIYPELDNVAVHMSGGSINIEALMTAQPDLILLKSTFYANDDEIAKLEKTGIPYLVVNYTNMKEQIFALDMIGKALGGEPEQKAQGINKYYQAVIDQAKTISKKIPKDETLKVYHAINELVLTDGPDTLGYDWITCVGAKNVAAEDNLVSEGSDYLASPEQIFVWNPDIIICNEKDTVSYLEQEPRWQSLDAVKNKKVYNIPIGATRWGQRGSLETFLAMLWLGTTIYPDYYQDIDLKTEVKSFYKDYLNLEIDDEIYNQMLSGKGLRDASNKAGS